MTDEQLRKLGTAASLEASALLVAEVARTGPIPPADRIAHIADRACVELIATLDPFFPLDAAQARVLLGTMLFQGLVTQLSASVTASRELLEKLVPAPPRDREPGGSPA